MTCKGEPDMEKYTSLDQAIQDPAIVIITDDINTLTELNKTYLHYTILSPRNRRISDYYSNAFLGHSVPEMYVIVKETLSTGLRVVDYIRNTELPVEKYTVTEPDLYYREDSFNAGETNLCFILGHSGSGKSVMARTLESDEIDHLELDDLLLIKDHFTMDELKLYSDMFYDYFSNEGAKYYIGIEERNSIPKEEYEDRLFVDFVNYAMDYAKKHPDRKYIIEGIWIYLYFAEMDLIFDNGGFCIKNRAMVLST